MDTKRRTIAKAFVWQLMGLVTMSHRFQTGDVNRLQDVERREQERSGTAGGVEDGDLVDRLPEGADQFGALAPRDHVLGKFFDVQVVGDEVVD